MDSADIEAGYQVLVLIGPDYANEFAKLASTVRQRTPAQPRWGHNHPIMLSIEAGCHLTSDNMCYVK